MPNGWSNYAKQQMPLIGGGAIPAPAFSMALFNGSANPDAGTTPSEVTAAGYLRQYVILGVSGAQLRALKNYAYITIPPASTGYAYVGCALVDNARNIWFWDDDHGQNVPAHTGVVFNVNSIVIAPAS